MLLIDLRGGEGARGNRITVAWDRTEILRVIITERRKTRCENRLKSMFLAHKWVVVLRERRGEPLIGASVIRYFLE